MAAEFKPRLGIEEDVATNPQSNLHPVGDVIALPSNSTLLIRGHLNRSDLAIIAKREELLRGKRQAKRIARIKGVIAGGILAVSAIFTVAKPVTDGIDYMRNAQAALQQNSDNWSDSNLSSEAFLAKYKNQIVEGTNIGAVFVPEEEGADLLNMNSKFGKIAYSNAEKTLDFMHNELNMNELTLGIREDNFVDKDSYNFKFYKPFLDKIFQYKMKVNLITGDKAPGWEEQHPALQDEPELKQIAANGGVVFANSKLAQDDLKHQTAFFKFLLTNYSKEDLKLINSLEFQNEFDNKYGNTDEQVVFDKGVIVMDARNSKQFLPGKRIVVSSAGPLNIDSVIRAVKALKDDDPNTKVGINIHDYSDDVGDLSAPLIGKFNALNTAAGRFSPLIYDKMALNELGKAAKFCNQTPDCEEIVGEAEGKAWDGNLGLPGDKVSDFHYELLNSIQIIDDDVKTSNIKYVGYWGIWDLVENRNNPKNKIIIDEIKKINTKNVETMVNLNPKQTFRVGGELVTLVDFAPLERAA